MSSIRLIGHSYSSRMAAGRHGGAPAVMHLFRCNSPLFSPTVLETRRAGGCIAARPCGRAEIWADSFRGFDGSSDGLLEMAEVCPCTVFIVGQRVCFSNDGPAILGPAFHWI